MVNFVGKVEAHYNIAIFIQHARRQHVATESDVWHLSQHRFNFTRPYLPSRTNDFHQNSYLGYSKSSSSHGVVRF